MKRKTRLRLWTIASALLSLALLVIGTVYAFRHDYAHGAYLLILSHILSYQAHELEREADALP